MADRRISDRHPLVLASASPRRREILRSLGVCHVVLQAPVDERELGGEGAHDYLLRVSRAKLDAALATRDAALAECAGVLAADTTVLIDGVMLGKPASIDEARDMLGRLSGRAHEVKTAFAIGAPEGALLHQEIVTSRVVFRAATQREIDLYAESGEGLDKAGAYAVQGGAMAFVSRIEGSYSGIVGLPACEVAVALSSLGLR
jgi:septum formation protein